MAVKVGKAAVIHKAQVARGQRLALGYPRTHPCIPISTAIFALTASGVQAKMARIAATLELAGTIAIST